MWRIGASVFGASTRLAPWVRPESRSPARSRIAPMSRSSPPSERSISARSVPETSPTSRMPSTNRRRPSWVGMRPAETCGLSSRPSSSRSCMTLRIVAARDAFAQRAAERARADRLAGVEIGLDQPAEHLAAALVHLGRAGSGAAVIGSGQLGSRRRRPRLTDRGTGAAVNASAASAGRRLDGAAGCGLRAAARTIREERPMRPSGRAADALRAVTHRDRRQPARRGVVPDPGRRHPRALHREPRGERAAVPAQDRARLGDGRVRHAAARDHDAEPARGDAPASSRGGRRRSSG